MQVKTKDIMVKDLDGMHFFKNLNLLTWDVFEYLILWRWIMGTIEAFWTWHTVVVEGKEAFIPDFWNELDFYSSSPEKPINFFEWTEL